MRIERVFVWSDDRPDDRDEIRSPEIAHHVTHEGRRFDSAPGMSATRKGNNASPTLSTTKSRSNRAFVSSRWRFVKRGEDPFLGRRRGVLWNEHEWRRAEGRLNQRHAHKSASTVSVTVPRLRTIALVALVVVLTDVTWNGTSLRISVGVPGRRRIIQLAFP